MDIKVKVILDEMSKIVSLCKDISFFNDICKQMSDFIDFHERIASKSLDVLVYSPRENTGWKKLCKKVVCDNYIYHEEMEAELQYYRLESHIYKNAEYSRLDEICNNKIDALHNEMELCDFMRKGGLGSRMDALYNDDADFIRKYELQDELMKSFPEKTIKARFLSSDIENIEFPSELKAANTLLNRQGPLGCSALFHAAKEQIKLQILEHFLENHGSKVTTNTIK